MFNDENGQTSHTRILSFILIIWCISYISMCTIFKLTPLLTSVDIVTLVGFAYGATTIKKPFENKDRFCNKDKEHG